MDDTPEIIHYLKLTEYYLAGDLKEIKLICTKAEENDLQQNVHPRISISGLYLRLITKTDFNFENSESAFFRLTLPLASAFFSTLDFLGYLVGDNDDARKTSKNFVEFFKYAQSLGFIVSDDEVDIANSVFRQGLAHTYLPKLNAGISYFSGNPPNQLFFNEMGKTLVLNLRYLESIVMTALNNVITDINLLERINSRYLSLQSEYTVAYSDKIESLLKKLD